MEVDFELHGGPWDGQTISSDSPCEVTAEFARVLYAVTRGAAIGARLQLVSPAGCNLRRREAALAMESIVRPHAYSVSRRIAGPQRVIVTAVHDGVQGK
jgi:hypothetical protein